MAIITMDFVESRKCLFTTLTKDRYRTMMQASTLSFLSSNCAVKMRREGAWWFNACFTSHLNGKYYHHGDVLFGHGIQWKLWKGHYYSPKKCSMKIREVL